MNKSKTKVMMETDTPIHVNNTRIENVERYIYMGQRYSTRDTNQEKEIQCKNIAGWTAFAKHRDIFKGNNVIEETNLKLVHFFGNDIRRGNMDTHNPCKEQASSRTNKDGKEYFKHYILEQKNKHMGKRKDQNHRRY